MKAKMRKQQESAVETATQHCLVYPLAPFKAFDKQGPDEVGISSIGMQIGPRFKSTDLDGVFHAMEFRVNNVEVPPGKKEELYHLGWDSEVCQGMGQ